MSKQVFETRWGFVAYSYEDYTKLKSLYKIFYKARTNAARWNRWARKAPHNRVQRKWVRNELGQKISFEIVGLMSEPNVCKLFSKKHRWFNEYVTDNLIELEYQKSRRPMSEADVVEGEFSSAKIDELLIEAEIWREEQKSK